jgi:putative hydrolase of the HAD superfamily
MRVLGGIRGVGFDLDGTLYANYKLNIRLLPFVMREFSFMYTFVKVRKRLHAGGALSGGFYDTQAGLMAAYLKEKPDAIREKLDRLVYRGWEEAFTHIRPFPRVTETLAAFKEAGLRLGVLSDFPPERKLEFLGLSGFFDAAFSTESAGALKPDPTPFRKLAKDLGLEPEEMLYVGNSPHYDIAGAHNAGMMTALIRRGVFSTGSGRLAGTRPGFIFHSYRQLRQYVLR